MSRHHPRTLLPVALGAVAVLVGACTSPDVRTNTVDTTTTRSPDTTTDPSSHEAIDLMQIPEDTSLEPGTYSVGLLHDDGPTRAIVEVPAGFNGRGLVIGSDDGDIAFWGNVTQVDTDPCLGGKHIVAGSTVRDLA